MQANHLTDFHVQELLPSNIDLVKVLIQEATNSITEASNSSELMLAFNNFQKLDNHFMQLVRATL